jgi:hypothetical protein
MAGPWARAAVALKIDTMQERCKQILQFAREARPLQNRAEADLSQSGLYLMQY